MHNDSEENDRPAPGGMADFQMVWNAAQKRNPWKPGTPADAAATLARALAPKSAAGDWLKSMLASALSRTTSGIRTLRCRAAEHQDKDSEAYTAPTRY